MSSADHALGAGRRVLLRRWYRAERGSGTVLALAIIGVVMTITLSAVLVGQSLVSLARARVAADAAALAAADTVSGRVQGSDPCQRAAQVAQAHDVVLEDCEAAAARTRVVVRANDPLLEIRVESVAGPPP
ncbi:Rv3654c family TadE-like protein [Gulosibacter hominis]|uniref:Rv3654c family TadE-like protein n=1 Tax=Gulosibacter hominis TaxID=2770504 RepID=UPI001918119A|nr:Rv3654c family TadE-like protein [Gulosibacter hominis]